MNNRSIFVILAAIAVAGTLAGQTAEPKRLAPTDKTAWGEPVLYKFQNLDDNTAYAVIDLARNMGFGVMITWEPLLHTAAIHSRSAETSQKVLEFLKRYDVPRPPEPQVKFVAYLIRASNVAPPAEAGSNGAGPLPKDLDEAVKEMKASLPYSRYDLLDTVRSVSHGSASASDSFPARGFADYSRGYNIRYTNVSVSPDRKSVDIRPFEFQLYSAAGKDNILSSISSNVTVREGQKLVLGKVRLGANADLFVVLTVKVE